MINLKILVPDSTTNYVTNPNFRNNTTGWTTAGATLTRVLTKSRFSIASGQVVTNGSVVNEGVYVRLTSLAGVNQPCTGSIYVLGSGKVRARLRDGGGASWVSDTVSLSPTQWTRLSASGFLTGTNDVRLYVETADVTAKAITFYVDGAQIELKAYATTYCDGDQPGCSWERVIPGVSSRPANTRLGGRWVPLAGDCRGNQDVYVTVLGGFGSAPIRNATQSWSEAPGGYYQNTKILDRVLNFSFYVKNESTRDAAPPNPAPLHALRQQLIDLFKPDRTEGGEPYWIEYSDTNADRPLYIQARYEAGLEGSWDARNSWVNALPVRMLALDPLWVEDNQDTSQLGILNTSSLSLGIHLAVIRNKKVSFLGRAGTTTASLFERMVEGTDGTIYMIAGGLIAKWDGSSFSTLATTDAGQVRDLDVAPDGSLYAVGQFTAIGGTAANRIAKYTPSTGTWSALGTGFDAEAASVCVAQNGHVYAGGSFSSAGGVTCRNIARWDGTQWRTVGATSGLNGNVYRIVRARNSDTLYVGGVFTASYGGSVTYNAIVSLNITTNLFSALGSGFSGQLGMAAGPSVYALAVGLDGTIYAGGSFTASGSESVSGIAQFGSGGLWKPLGDGLDNGVFALEIDQDGVLWVGGGFHGTASGDISLPSGFAKFFLNAWSSPDFKTTGSGPRDIVSARNGDIFFLISAGATIQASYPYYNSVANIGSAEVYPRMYIKGQGTFKYIINTRTGAFLALDLQILANEEVFIDFGRGVIESTVRGSLLYSILPGSDIRAMRMLPGENEFGILITDDVGAIAQMSYTPQHWSADAIAKVELL